MLKVQRTLLAFFAVFIGVCTGTTLANPKEQSIDHASIIEPLLPDVFQDGVHESFAAADFRAFKENDGQLRAACVISVVYTSRGHQHISLSYASTDDGSIEIVSNTPLAISPRMHLTRPDQPILFVAKRKSEEGYNYNASAVGLWTGVPDETKFVRTEWRQVKTIDLPIAQIE